MENMEKLPILTISGGGGGYWAAVIENEGDYNSDDNIYINQLCFYIFRSKTITFQLCQYYCMAAPSGL